MACIAALGSSAVGASANPAASTVHRAHQPGLHITGHGYLPDRYGQTVRTASGELHVITTSLNRPGHHHIRLEYRTQRPRQDTWIHHVVPGLRSRCGATEMHLSNNGKRVFVVSYDADGVYLTDASATATILSAPRLILKAKLCDENGFRYNWGEFPVQRAISLGTGSPGPAGDRIGIMLDDPANADEPTIFAGYGTPATPFTRLSVVPTDDGAFIPSQLVRDASTGRLTVTGSGFANNRERVFAVQKGNFDAGWSDPVELAHHSGRDPYALFIQSIAAGNGRSWVGVAKRHAYFRPGRQVLYLLTRGRKGTWSGEIPVPHTNSNDAAMILATNPKNGHLHIAFTRNTRSSHYARQQTRSGLRVEMEKQGGGWTKPKVITQWFHDRAEQLMVTSTGRNVIAYARI